MNKILPSKSHFLLIAVLALHFLFIASGKEFLHNHTPDGKTHDDCPVVIINDILTSGIISHFEIFTQQSIEVFIPFTYETIFSKPEVSCVTLRAPPIG